MSTLYALPIHTRLIEFRFALEKSRVISALRSPTREDGPIVRTMWKRACVLENDPQHRYDDEAKYLKRRAERLKEGLMLSGEGGTIPYADQHGSEVDQEEGSYDALVPLFFR